MERMDLYDEDRLLLGRTAERREPVGPGEYRAVVHVVLFGPDHRMLIQRRSMEKRSLPGLWDVSVGGAVMAGETCRRAAERETAEELGYALDLSGVRPSVTVNFDGGFDDFYIVVRDVDLDSLRLQAEEVMDACWATEEEVLELLRRGAFIPYPDSFLRFLFEMWDTFGFLAK